MPARSTNTFTTIRTEGALLPPDLLRRIADGDSTLAGLKPEDYHRPGEKLNEIINRAWNALQGAWANFKSAQDRLPTGDLGTSITRERWLLPLFRELDYGRLPVAPTFQIDGKSYPISHQWEQVPIHLVSYQLDLDRRTPGIAGAAVASPHSLLQIFLNRSNDHLWGFVSNGYRLRILRDNASLTRQAYVEFDLQAMMEGEVYADFVLLWLLCHQSRVERGRECWLEKWMRTAEQQGTRALDQLRDGVQRAIEALGVGFLEHPRNTALRDKLHAGTLTKEDYYRQLLRLVYRLLFLFVAEDRGLLYDPVAPEQAREVYQQHYSTQRLRHIAERLKGTRHTDLFESLRLVMKLLSGDSNGAGQPLGLPVLGSFLFSDDAVQDVIGCQLANVHLLDAVRALAFMQDRAVRLLRPVDYKNLDSDELGSIYESLLELHPQINVEARTFTLATAGGNERKTTGSYYTPSSLIYALLDSALNPVIDEAAKKPNPEAALLDLKICDPACGSGHFLIAAAHRIAKRLASVRTGEEEPAPAAVRHALRDVIGNCIYGVDINPMAVELGKVNLWLEALEPGKPLSFLDHRIQCGNSLIGTTPALMAQGIPDDAFNPIEGDDPKIAAKIKKDNRQARKDRETGQQNFLHLAEPPADYHALAAEVDSLDAIDSDTLAGIRAKEERYRRLANDSEYQKARGLADAWCAAFVWDKTANNGLPPMTDLLYRRLQDNPLDPQLTNLRAYVEALREHYQFFHWHVAFPDVFDMVDNPQSAENPQTGWNGGFSCVLGNPPWEGLQTDPIEFFAIMAPDISGATNMAQRKKMIKQLKQYDPNLYNGWVAEVRTDEATRHLINRGGFFPLTSFGRLNTYSLFAELAGNIVRPLGKWGMILPIGIATDAFNQHFFGQLIEGKRLVSLFGFENEELVFPTVHHAFKFGLMTVAGQSDVEKPELAFSLRSTAELSNIGRRYRLSVEDFKLINPNTLTCPVFRCERDAELTRTVYERFPIILHEETNESPWRVRCQLMYMMNTVTEVAATTDELRAKGFTITPTTVRSLEQWLPLYEAKMFHQFDHRFGTYLNQTVEQANQGKLPELSTEHLDPAHFPVPRYWLTRSEVETALSVTEQRGWLVAWRDVTSAVVFRTAILAFLPIAATNDSAALAHFPDNSASEVSCFVANANAFVFDFIARQKLGGNHLRFFTFYQLPAIVPTAYGPDLLACIVPRVLELTYTAWDLQPFAHDVGYDGPPFIWNEDRRFLMRCELDALYFHLYGIARDDVDYIMETFPIVKRKDEAAHGEYRTKRVILEMYDEMAQCGGVEGYQTRLDPPPADPRVAHKNDHL